MAFTFDPSSSTAVGWADRHDPFLASTSSGRRERSYRKKRPIGDYKHKSGVTDRMREQFFKVKRRERYSQSNDAFNILNKGKAPVRKTTTKITADTFSTPTSQVAAPRIPTSAVTADIFSKPAGRFVPSHFQSTQSWLFEQLGRVQDFITRPAPQKPNWQEYDRRIKEKEKAVKALLRRPSLPADLPPEASAEVDRLFGLPGKVSSIPGAEVAAKDFAKLRPRQWLNDEVINFYGKLIVNRSDRIEERAKKGEKSLSKEEHKFLKVHFFNSFWYKQMSDVGYQSVRRWTRKVDIFSKDIVLIPINLGNAHWTCAAINLRKKRFEYYDSMGSENCAAFQIMREYLAKEHLDKKGKPMDLSDWENYFSPYSPQQENGYDCGVFACVTLEVLSKGGPDNEGGEDEDWGFGQKDMPFLRRRIAWEIGRQKLSSEP